ncbi:MAG: alpha/beta hydrolase [Hyphomicrobiales bacterium]|nr:MAG: alpha/beta hydrolase [Hyphomicrobiales bacterium]
MVFIDYEAQYNNRKRVPDHPEIIAGWARDAASYRETARCETGVRYDIATRCTYDIFHPDAVAPNAPLAVFIHGGYWQALDSSFFSHMARGLNARGMTVVVANYDLCPQVRIGDIIEQIRVLCAFLWESFRKPLLLYGHSAGGHLTAATMSTDWPARGLPYRLVPAGYAISGLFDLVPLVGTSINDAMGMTQSEAIKASPLAMGVPGGTSLTAAVGSAESEEFIRQSRVIVDFWARGGASTKLELIKDANHFTVIAPLADPQSSMVDEIVRIAGLR